MTYGVKNIANQDDWEIRNLRLNAANLIVGKNAAGKSRTVQLIASFAKMISRQVSSLNFGNWDMLFETEEGGKLNYILKIKGGNVLEEKIIINEKELLLRDKITKIYSFKAKKIITINPPDNKLVLHVRRDQEEFPFLEEIVAWAEQTYGFKFGNITPYSYLIDRETDQLTSVDKITHMLETLAVSEFTGDPLTQGFHERVITDFNSLGYDIKKITRGTEKGKDILLIKEGNLKNYIPQNALSQGMFRALVLLLFMEYMISTKQVATIIIDDLCEGLDYERATKLGKLIFSKNKNNNFQLIATTNDSFLMDCVDIENWNVLIRKDDVVEAFNYENNAALFKEFRFTGLSNFDLFSSDYLLNKK